MSTTVGRGCRFNRKMPTTRRGMRTYGNGNRRKSLFLFLESWSARLMRQAQAIALGGPARGHFVSAPARHCDAAQVHRPLAARCGGGWVDSRRLVHHVLRSLGDSSLEPAMGMVVDAAVFHRRLASVRSIRDGSPTCRLRLMTAAAIRHSPAAPAQQKRDGGPKPSIPR